MNVVALRILIILWILFTWLSPPMLAQRASSAAGKRRLALCALALSVIGLYLLVVASGGRARTADVIAGSALVFVSAAHTFRSNLFERR
jgi:hypothetical protein